MLLFYTFLTKYIIIFLSFDYIKILKKEKP